MAAMAVAGLLLGVFLIILFVTLGMLFEERPITFEEGSVLVLDLSVNICDSPRDLNPLDLIRNNLDGPSAPSLVLKNLLEGLNKAAEDERISALFLHGSLQTDNLSSSYAALREVREAVRHFEDSGKPVIAYLVAPSLRDYYVASAAGTVILNPFGMVMIKGLASELIYLGNAFKKYGIGVQVFSAGKYKSFGEQFTRDSMSEEHRYQMTVLLEKLWNEILSGISRDRGIDIDTLNEISRQRGLFTATQALDHGLVDEIAYFDEVIDKLIGIGVYDKDNKSFAQVNFNDYRQALDFSSEEDKPIIAVIYAEGVIVDGEGGFRSVGGDKLARQLRKLRRDEEIKAVVLRVNSPGGSAVASEIIQREIRLIGEEKPIVISMGGVAASGGYWIAAAGDTIFAEQTTITGSIGVVGLFPNVQVIAREHGIHFDGVKTGPFADIFSISRPKTPREAELFEEMIDFIYVEFVKLVAEGRNLTIEQVEQIAQGRVWSGSDALRVGLVDNIGGLNDAITHAAEKAGLGEDFTLIQIPEGKDVSELLEELLGGDPGQDPLTLLGPFSRSLRKLQEELSILGSLNDPRGIYALMPFIFRLD